MNWKKKESRVLEDTLIEIIYNLKNGEKRRMKKHEQSTTENEKSTEQRFK